MCYKGLGDYNGDKIQEHPNKIIVTVSVNTTNEGKKKIMRGDTTTPRPDPGPKS